MTFSPNNESAFNDTNLRSKNIAPASGMCSLCSAECTGVCEVGLSAVLGKAMVYPTNTGDNQIASEKNNPLNYSIFNINGRCFGAKGAAENSEEATIFNVKLSRQTHGKNPVKLNVPLVLPALIKLNWRDYFSAAAMIGTVCVIGESSPGKDPNFEYKNGKITRFDMLTQILHAFNKYDRGYGQIVLQCNVEDDAIGLPEYAITKYGVKAIEIKFGQSAKGTQPAVRLRSFEEAKTKKDSGNLVSPDPYNPAIAELAKKGQAPVFWSYSRLPMWSEESLLKHITKLRELGMENLYFKMAGVDITDIERVLRLASEAAVDMITFDGAGGGSGYSPNKMMNEFGLSAVCIESALIGICRKLEAEGRYIPFITITGGISTEDQAFKALAIGAPYIKAVGLGRATMAAAMVGDKIGGLLESGKPPTHLKKFGNTKEELFLELGELRTLYGDMADEIPLGAVGAYSYLKKIAFGLQHFAALNRKFDIDLIDASDVIPLTEEAKKLLRGTWFSS